jgi:hypothetical protein
VCRARSRANFINKLAGAIEECDESALWLEILSEAAICPASATTPLWREADELTRILVRSRETARTNQRSANRQLIKNQQSPINNESRIKTIANPYDHLTLALAPELLRMTPQMLAPIGRKKSPDNLTLQPRIPAHEHFQQTAGDIAAVGHNRQVAQWKIVIGRRNSRPRLSHPARQSRRNSTEAA